jgi:glutamine cyclotransferase
MLAILTIMAQLHVGWTVAVQKRAPLAPELFGEGIAPLGDTVVMLTWREQTGKVSLRLGARGLTSLSLKTANVVRQ